MSQALVQLPDDLVNKLVMTGDVSGLTDSQRSQYLIYRCKMVGIDPAGMPFNLLKQKNKDGSEKVVVYANKECSAQLASNRKLSALCVSEGEINGGIYKVVYRVGEIIAVTNDGSGKLNAEKRETEDCGSVSLMYWDKDGQPRGWKKLEGEGLSNAIMKCHTKAKRRAILTHCGLGMNDESEDIPGQKEEVKPATAVVKADSKVVSVGLPAGPSSGSASVPEPLVVPDNQPIYVTAAAANVEEMKKSDKTPVWKVTVGAIDYYTLDPLLAEAAKVFCERISMVKVGYEATTSGKLRLLSMSEVKDAR